MDMTKFLSAVLLSGVSAMVSLIHCANITGQDIESELIARQKCSVFESVIVNGNAWRSGDFLFRIHSSLDSINKKNAKINLDGIVVESELLCRVAFDFDACNLCVLTWKREAVLDLTRTDKGLDPRLETTSMNAIALGSRRRLFSRTFPSRMVVKKLAIEERYDDSDEAFQDQFFKVVGRTMPDFRGIGPVRNGAPGSFKYASEVVNKLKTGTRLHKDSELGNGLFELQIKSPGSGVVSYQINKYVFSRKHNLPVSVQEWWYIDSPPAGAPPESLYASLDVDWKNISGVWVPESIHQEQNMALRIGQVGKRYTGRQFNDTKFHWFSLNGAPNKIPPELFNGECMNDMASFLRFVDPLKAGAKTLIPISNDSSSGPADEKIN